MACLCTDRTLDGYCIRAAIAGTPRTEHGIYNAQLVVLNLQAAGRTQNARDWNVHQHVGRRSIVCLDDEG